jgi:hypothetical protein
MFGSSTTIGIAEQSRQQVLKLDELVIVAHRQTLGIGQRCLELGGEFFVAHVVSFEYDCLKNGGGAPDFK